MNFWNLIAFCLILISTDANDALNPHQKNDFIEIVQMLNQIKDLLDEGTESYKITWDTSLALYASERIDKCPLAVSEGEVFAKADEVVKLYQNLNSNDSFSLDPFPTIAIFRNRDARIHLDIGSRIGCAYKNCSTGNDLLCVFDNRKIAQDRLGKQECVKDKHFSNLCEERPIDYWSMDPKEFEWRMMRWNEQRRAVAKKFSISGMYQLTWSDDATRFATVLGSSCDPDCAGFVGTHFHMHPRTLDALGSLWILTHDHLDGSSVYGNSTIEMFAPQRTEFGCAPLDPAVCKDYSYICVLGPDWSSSSPIVLSQGELCGECLDRCQDGLCQALKEDNSEVQVSLSDQNLNGTMTSTPAYTSWNSNWKIFGLLVCFAGAVGVALFLLYALVFNHYHF